MPRFKSQVRKSKGPLCVWFVRIVHSSPLWGYTLDLTLVNCPSPAHFVVKDVDKEEMPESNALDDLKEGKKDTDFEEIEDEA